jgi:hypothetical protein
MADRYVVTLGNSFSRDKAKRIVEQAPEGYVFSVSPPKRTNDQNAKMWAMLTDISLAKPEGRMLTPDVWKSLFLHALDHSIRFEPALDGNGMVPMGFRSSKLTKAQMGDLLDLIGEYGARHQVVWSDESGGGGV